MRFSYESMTLRYDYGDGSSEVRRTNMYKRADGTYGISPARRVFQAVKIVDTKTGYIYKDRYGRAGQYEIIDHFENELFKIESL